MDLTRTRAPHPIDLLPAAPAELEVTSSDFTDGGALPESAGFAAGNVSPQLSWSGAPEGTKSYLVVCHDPDAPVMGGFSHWGVLFVPGDVTSLDAGAGTTDGGTGTGSLALPNDYGMSGWGGCAPPEGDGPHRYVFTVWALDTDSVEGLDADTPIAKAQFMTMEHQIARGTITGTYEL